MATDLTEAERIEIDHWAHSESERPGVFSVGNLINKLTDAPVLLSRLDPFLEEFASAARVLELGAGQGWGSCLLQALAPPRRPRHICTDISHHALQSAPMWEGIFRTRLSGSAACRSYELPFRNAAFDVVFAFQAAHHFRAHQRTLAEIHRVLVPGGLALYLHEPSCPRWIHPLAVRRVRSSRPDVPEDVLVHDEMLSIARGAGFDASHRDDCSLEKRRPLEFLYYMVLGRLSPLRRLLPCTRDYVLRKRS